VRTSSGPMGLRTMGGWVEACAAWATSACMSGRLLRGPGHRLDADVLQTEAGARDGPAIATSLSAPHHVVRARFDLLQDGLGVQADEEDGRHDRHDDEVLHGVQVPQVTPQVPPP